MSYVVLVRKAQETLHLFAMTEAICWSPARLPGPDECGHHWVMSVPVG